LNGDFLSSRIVDKHFFSWHLPVHAGFAGRALLAARKQSEIGRRVFTPPG